MAKKILTQDTTNYNNVQALPDLVEEQSTLVKQTFDKAGNDQKTFMNSTHIAELQSSTTGTSGSYGVGHGSASIAADNVGDALEENRLLIDTSETDITALEGRVTTNEGDITSLDGRVTTNEGDILTLQTADGQNVKLTGNQTIAGTKTFSSNVVVPTTPTLSTHATSKGYVDSQSPLTIPNNSLTELKMAAEMKKQAGGVYPYDEGQINRDKLDNSFYADLNAYYGNTKLADDSQNASDYSSGTGLISNDTTNFKLGSQSVRLTEQDNTGNLQQMFLNNISLDFTELNNGETSGDSDFILLVVFIDDVAFTNNVSLSFSDASTYDPNNDAAYVWDTGLVTGWNYLKAQKSDFTIAGTFTWDNIQSCRYGWNSADNAQNKYVSYQLTQLVKKDPNLAIPNPLQRFGVVDFNINSGEWFVGLEFGKIIARELERGASIVNALQNTGEFSNFVIDSIKQVVGSSAFEAYVTWYVDADNYITCLVNADNLLLRKVEGGVFDNTNTLPLNISEGDNIEYILNKKDEKLSLTVYLNGDYSNPYTINTTTAISTTSTGNLCIGASVSENSMFSSASITEITHAHHADIAEVAKGLVEQPNDTLVGGTQSIPDDTDTKIDWLTSENDDKYKFLDATNQSRVWLRNRGKYLITVKVGYVSNATGYRFIYAKKNGSATIEAFDNKNAVNGAITWIISTFPIDSDGDDYLEIFTAQNSGGALNITNTPNRSVRLEIQKIG